MKETDAHKSRGAHTEVRCKPPVVAHGGGDLFFKNASKVALIFVRSRRSIGRIEMRWLAVGQGHRTGSKHPAACVPAQVGYSPEHLVASAYQMASHMVKPGRSSCQSRPAIP